jgi:hypothetical protein
MTVKELIKILSDQPENMEVVVSRHSDWERVSEVERVRGVAVGGPSGWIRRSHVSEPDPGECFVYLS